MCFPNRSPAARPPAGFDQYFGTDVPNWPPYCFIENDRTVGIPSVFLPPELLGDNLASKQGPALKDWKLEDILPTLVDHAVQVHHGLRGEERAVPALSAVHLAAHAACGQ